MAIEAPKNTDFEGIYKGLDGTLVGCRKENCSVSCCEPKINPETIPDPTVYMTAMPPGEFLFQVEKGWIDLDQNQVDQFFSTGRIVARNGISFTLIQVNFGDTHGIMINVNHCKDEVTGACKFVRKCLACTSFPFNFDAEKAIARKDCASETNCTCPHRDEIVARNPAFILKILDIRKKIGKTDNGAWQNTLCRILRSGR